MTSYIPFNTAGEAQARSREWWTAILEREKYEQDVTEFAFAWRERTGDPESDAGLPDGVDVAIVVPVRSAMLDTLVRADELTPDELAALVNLYDGWMVGAAYVIGDLVAYDDQLYRVVQAHTSQADWTPDVTPALFTRMTPENVIPEWVQPTGAQDAYALDALATHNGRVWRSLMNANTYEPGVIGSWRDQSDPPLWVAPVGAIGLWQIGNVAWYNGAAWRCTAANNTYAPGVWGWVRV